MKSTITLSEKERQDAFPSALQIQIHESDSLWQISNVFLLANSIISTIVATTLFNSININRFSVGYISVSVIGLILSLVWLFSIERARKYYLFRIAQAKQREPKKWRLVNGDVEDFAKGASIEIDGKDYSVGFGIFSNIALVKIIVIVFILFYLGILVMQLLPHKTINFQRNSIIRIYR